MRFMLTYVHKSLAKTDVIYLLTIFAIATIVFLPLYSYPGRILGPNESDIPYTLAYYNEMFKSEFANTGYITQWNSLAASGHPFFANPISAPLSLSTFLYIFISYYSFTITSIIYIFLCGAFTYIYSRQIKLSKEESLLGSFAYMLSGVVFTKIFAGHLLLLGSMAFLPAMLSIAEISIRCGLKLKIILFGTMVMFLQGVTGGIQIAFYNAIIFVLYYIFRSLSIYKAYGDVNRLLNGSLVITIIFILFLALFAYQLIPMLEFYKLSVRESNSTSDAYPLRPEYTANFIFANILDSPNYNFGFTNFWEFVPYIGIILLLLSIIGIVFSENKLRYTLLFLSIIIFFLSFGSNMPFFALIAKIIPFFDKFRFPSRILYGFVFFISILSAMGAGALAGNIRERKPIIIIISIVSIIFIFITIILYTNTMHVYDFLHNVILSSSKNSINDASVLSALSKINNLDKNFPVIYNNILTASIWMSLFSISLLSIAYIRKYFNIKPQKTLLYITVIILIESLSYGLPYINYLNSDEVYSINNNIGEINHTTYRFYLDKNNFTPLTLALHNIRSYQVYDPGILKSYSDFLSRFNCTEFCSGKGAQILSIKYYYIQNTKVLNTTQNKTIYEQATIPYVRILYNNYVVDEEDSLAELESDRYDPTNTVIVTSSIPRINTIGNGTIEIVDYRSGYIKLNITTSTPGVIVISENYYPGWHALVDGEKRDVIKVNYLQIGLPIAEGQHTAVVYFFSNTILMGIIITSVTLLLFILAILSQLLK